MSYFERKAFIYGAHMIKGGLVDWDTGRKLPPPKRPPRGHADV
jgi:hypothetical protein